MAAPDLLKEIRVHTEVLPPESGGRFILSSGLKSYYRIDLIPVALKHPRAIGGWVALQARRMGAKAVAGVEFGGLLVAQTSKLPLVVVRKSDEVYGDTNLPVAIVDDVATTRGTVQKARERLQRLGFDVRGVIVVVDRQEQEKVHPADRKKDIPFIARFTGKQVLGKEWRG